tara:strand:+ start:10084 stop:10698 length:615 start_codon:yes stop_codon:yes gene_type:complete
VTNIVTLIADHKGIAKPFVVGHQYVSLASVAISSYRTGSPATAANQTLVAADADPDTITRAAGNFITDGFVVGDYGTLSDSTTANDKVAFRIATITATGSNAGRVLTADPVGTSGTLAADNGGNEEFTHAGEKLLAADFGLATFTQVEVSNPSMLNFNYTVGAISSDGTFCYLYCTKLGSVLTDGVVALAENVGAVTVRATGLL